MELTLIIGYIAASLVIITPIPQLYKIIKTKSSKDISILTYSFLLLAQILFIFYGLLKKDVIIIFTNITSSFITTFIVIFSLYFQLTRNTY